MNYRCEDAAEALAAYALDALSPVERLAMLEHLAECRRHDEELAGYRMVAGRLPLLIEATEAPPVPLRGSLLSAFDRELSGTAQEEAAPQTVVTTRAPELVERRPRGGLLAIFRQPSLAYGIAAALLIAVLGLAAWNLDMRSNDESSVMVAAADVPGFTLDVTYYPSQQVAVVTMEMPDPPPGQVYQAWMIADGKPVSLGVLESAHGTVAFATDMSKASAIAISVEPPGGSIAPTTQPIVVAQF